MRIVDVEPMVNMFQGSATYGKAFGVKLRYSDGHTKRCTDISVALAANLTKKQRSYVERLRRQIEAERGGQ